ncbi:hypothetical protein K7X08_013203 [Anisodus acutangulus]|uniref:Hydroxymethylglutaryl-CoA synthase n=1 Tax=Anisodus acutangulus TaxID=402998 RepID=A0A9Q1MAR0_9SOLA|nr:hypothetical protein K7X08_013203 [Anisodus acutangulus]
MASEPKNVGILAMEIYFPPTCLQQEVLEAHDGASKGKYTIGLGQDCMGFCTEVEDVISMSLTAVTSLLEKYAIDPKQLGRLEVGSETVIDKSKSIKTFLMQIFEKHGNTDIEGVDSTNACYGGTAALFNCVNWVESSSWDGRYGLVVCTDSAVYAEGPARPTGGAAAIAMLVGPDAPIVFESKIRASHMSHAYDFYKPVLDSEYPVVDGKLSQTCYLMALDTCYKSLCNKYEKLEGRQFSMADAAYFVFHSPYNKLVQKSFGRLVFNDFRRNASSIDESAKQILAPFESLTGEESYQSRDLEKASQQVAKPFYDEKVQPTTLIPKQVGNMYTASLYAAFASLLHNKHDTLAGQRVIMFSYGSGLTATMFSLKFNKGQHPFSLSNIASVMNVAEKLKSRHEFTPEKFVEILKLMKHRYGAKDFVTSKDCSLLAPGTYYLTEVDSKYRRFYAKKAPEHGQSMASQPKNVGILAMEIHFPPTRIVLEELEAHDVVSKGGYTIGSGQDCMGFVIEDEDVVSMSMTAVTFLLEKYAIDPKQIGRLDVGTETIIDKSKSIKTFLMRIFEEHGNTDIEGVDSHNSSYGGTAALFNCVNWVESSSWDGRYGLVVCTDSAVYAKGPARATGGAAAIAMLVGPDAPIVFESKIRASHMSHVYDIYKPILDSEDCMVDDEISQTCYLTTLDSCYNGEQFSIDDAAYFVFHSPYNTLVQKSFGRLLYNDFLRNASSIDESAKQILAPFESLTADESYQSRDLDEASQQVAKPFYDEKVEPTTLIPKQVGNMYTASLYAAFASLLYNKHDTLAGQRVIMFSYGGGSTATMFSLKLNEGQHPFSLSNIASVMNVAERLEKRYEYSPEEFDIFVGLYEMRREFGIKNDYWARMPGGLLPIGAYYHRGVDSEYRRAYDKKTPEIEEYIEEIEEYIEE